MPMREGWVNIYRPSESNRHHATYAHVPGSAVHLSEEAARTNARVFGHTVGEYAATVKIQWREKAEPKVAYLVKYSSGNGGFSSCPHLTEIDAQRYADFLNDKHDPVCRGYRVVKVTEEEVAPE